MKQILNSKVKYPLFYALYLIAVWTFYRLSGINVPQEIDEFLVKPIVWLFPLFLLVRKQKSWIKSLGITRENLLPGIYFAAVLGLIFAIEAFVVGYLKKGNFDFAQSFGQKAILYSLFISLGTAVSQEIAFRGYIFNRFWGFFKSEVLANLITSLLWLIIHIPASIVLFGYSAGDAVSFLLLAFLYSLGASFIFARTKNVFSTILFYVLWEAPIILFR